MFWAWAGSIPDRHLAPAAGIAEQHDQVRLAASRAMPRSAISSQWDLAGAEPLSIMAGAPGRRCFTGLARPVRAIGGAQPKGRAGWRGWAVHFAIDLATASLSTASPDRLLNCTAMAFPRRCPERLNRRPWPPSAGAGESRAGLRSATGSVVTWSGGHVDGLRPCVAIKPSNRLWSWSCMADPAYGRTSATGGQRGRRLASSLTVGGIQAGPGSGLDRP